MGKVTIQAYTAQFPITLMGKEAGICTDADITAREKNYKRGLDCLKSQHGRTFEFPDVYMILEGYSARVIREFYTHIGGNPTRLQASTRYIDYNNFEYVIPKSIQSSEKATALYIHIMNSIRDSLSEFEKLGVPKEDSSMILPLCMKTKIVCKMNLRTLIEMSHQRMCSRAYWEYRELFNDICNALRVYWNEPNHAEWEYIVKNYFVPKCEWLGYCTESKSCGRRPKRTV